MKENTKEEKFFTTQDDYEPDRPGLKDLKIRDWTDPPSYPNNTGIPKRPILSTSGSDSDSDLGIEQILFDMNIYIRAVSLKYKRATFDQNLN